MTESNKEGSTASQVTVYFKMTFQKGSFCLLNLFETTFPIGHGSKRAQAVEPPGQLAGAGEAAQRFSSSKQAP